MKKNGISIDLIAFGELGEDNVKKLEAFNENCQSAEGSYLAVIQPSPKLLSDSIVATPILAGGGGAGAGGEGSEGGADQFEFGVDPSLDPALAMALRISYEEEKARQEREEKRAKEVEGKTELEKIPEGDEKQPLLDKDGEPSGSGSKEGEEDKKKDDDSDKMDTA